MHRTFLNFFDCHVSKLFDNRLVSSPFKLGIFKRWMPARQTAVWSSYHEPNERSGLQKKRENLQKSVSRSQVDLVWLKKQFQNSKTDHKNVCEIKVPFPASNWSPRSTGGLQWTSRWTSSKSFYLALKRLAKLCISKRCRWSLSDRLYRVYWFLTSGSILPDSYYQVYRLCSLNSVQHRTATKDNLKARYMKWAAIRGF